MAGLSSAKRYAQAVFAIAQEKDQVDVWNVELRAIEDTLKNDDLRSALSQAAVPMSAKANIVREAFADVSSLGQNLICLLVERRRLGLLPEIRAQFSHLLDEYHGREHVQLVSAVPLDAGAQEAASRLLQGIVNKEVVLDTRVDPDILGGLIVRVGDKLIDGSVKGRLRDLGRELSGNR
jgi:F-type H+-transporting ATPase subunit delta